MCKEKRFWSGILFNYLAGVFGKAGDKEADEIVWQSYLENKTEYGT